MKKYLFNLLLILLLVMPTGAWGANWFAGSGDTDFNAVSGGTTSSVWNSNADGTSGTYLDWSTGPANGDVFIANGATLAIDANIGSESVTVTLTTEGSDYSGTDGGGFTYATAGNLTLYVDIVAGTTDCLTITGSTGGGAIIGDITGGSSTNADGVSDTHTSVTVTVTGSITGGSASNANGYFKSGTSAGGLTITGNVTGAVGYGLNSSGGTNPTVNGDCVGSGTNATYSGCFGSSADTDDHILVTGNIIAGASASGAHGRIRWEPSSAQKYVLFDGGGTAIYASAGLGSDAEGTQVSAANTAAEIATGKYFVKKDDHVYTQGTKSSASGGGASAW